MQGSSRKVYLDNILVLHYDTIVYCIVRYYTMYQRSFGCGFGLSCSALKAWIYEAKGSIRKPTSYIMNTLSRRSPKNTKVLNLTSLTPYYTYIPENAKILNCRPQAQEPGALGPDGALPGVEQEFHQHTPGGLEAPGFGIFKSGV